MKKLIVSLVLCLGICSQSLWAITVYESKQTDGVPHFSDQPSLGAKAVMVTSSSTTGIPPAPNQTPSNPQAVATPQAVYNELMITAPSNEATINSNNGDVPVSIAITPALRADDALQIVVDGKIIITQKKMTPLTLGGVTRGTHILLVQILDGSGQIIKTSPSVTFYLHSAQK